MFNKSDIKSFWYLFISSWFMGFARIPILVKGDVAFKKRSIRAISWRNFTVEVRKLVSILRTNVERI